MATMVDHGPSVLKESLNDSPNQNLTKSFVGSLFDSSLIENQLLRSIGEMIASNPHSELTRKVTNLMNEKIDEMVDTCNRRIRIKCNLSKEDIDYLTAEIPTFEFVVDKYPDVLCHPRSAAIRKIELHLIMNEVSNFYKNVIMPSKYQAQVVDVGGKVFQHLSGDYTVHICLGGVDNKDVHRFPRHLLTISQKPTAIEFAKTNVCNNVAQNCCVTAPICVFLHSTYDMTTRTIADIMFMKRSVVGHISLLYDPLIILDGFDKGYIEAQRVYWFKETINGVKYVSFTFKDGSLDYKHELNNYISLLTTPVIFSTYGVAYALEPRKPIAGTIRIIAVPVIEVPREFIFRVHLDCSIYKDNLMVSFLVSANTGLFYSTYDRLIKNCDTDVQKALRGMKRVYELFPKKLFEDCVIHAMDYLKASDTDVLNKVVKYAKSRNQVFIINVTAVTETSTRIGPEKIVRLATAAVQSAYVLRFDMAVSFRGFSVLENNARNSFTPTFWERVKALVTCRSVADLLIDETNFSYVDKPMSKEQERIMKLLTYFRPIVSQVEISVEGSIRTKDMEAYSELPGYVVNVKAKIANDVLDDSEEKQTEIPLDKTFVEQKNPSASINHGFLTNAPCEHSACDMDVFKINGDGLCGLRVISEVLGITLREVAESIVTECPRIKKEVEEYLNNERKDVWITFQEIQDLLAVYGVATCYHTTNNFITLPINSNIVGYAHVHYDTNHFDLYIPRKGEKLNISVSKAFNSKHFSVALVDFNGMDNDFSSKEFSEEMVKDKNLSNFKKSTFHDIHKKYFTGSMDEIESIKLYHKIEKLNDGFPKMDISEIGESFCVKIMSDELPKYVQELNKIAACFHRVTIDRPSSVYMAKKTIFIVMNKMTSYVSEEEIELFDKAYMMNIDRIIATRRLRCLKKAYANKDLFEQAGGFLEDLKKHRDTSLVRLSFDSVNVYTLLSVLTNGSSDCLIDALKFIKKHFLDFCNGCETVSKADSKPVVVTCEQEELVIMMNKHGARFFEVDLQRGLRRLIGKSKSVDVEVNPSNTGTIFVNSGVNLPYSAELAAYCRPTSEISRTSPVHRHYQTRKIKGKSSGLGRFIGHTKKFLKIKRKKVILNQFVDKRFDAELPKMNSSSTESSVDFVGLRKKILKDLMEALASGQEESLLNCAKLMKKDKEDLIVEEEVVEETAIQVGSKMPFEVVGRNIGNEISVEMAVVDKKNYDEVQKSMAEYLVIMNHVNRSAKDSVTHFFQTIGTYVSEPLHSAWNLTPDAFNHVNECYPVLGVVTKKKDLQGKTEYVVTKMPNERYRTDITKVSYVYDRSANLVTVEEYFEDPTLVNALFHVETFYNYHGTVLKNLNEEPMQKCKITLINGGPGTGKTYDLIKEHNVNKDLVLSVSRGAISNIQERVNARCIANCDSFRLNRKQYRTTQSYLLNPNVKADRIFVDECFMMHAGELYHAIKASGAKEVYLYGDMQQTVYACRVPILQEFIKYAEISKSNISETKFKAESRRCPQDVVEIPFIKNIYSSTGMTTKKFSTFSKVEKSLETMIIANVNEVPNNFDDRTCYLVFTKADRTELKKFLGPKANVGTIGEKQGGEWEKVILVRLNSLHACPLFKDKSQQFVALTRHTKNFMYATVVADEVYGYIAVGGYVQSSFEHLSRPAEICVEKYSSASKKAEDLYDSLMIEFADKHFIDDDNLVYETRPEINLSRIKQEINPSVFVLQDAYENFAGCENSTMDNTYYNEFAMMDPKELQLAPGKISVGNFSGDKVAEGVDYGLKPVLRTSCPRTAEDSVISLAAAIKERNNGVPELAMPLDHIGVSYYAVERFFECYVDQDRFNNQVKTVLRPNPTAIADWLQTQDADIIQRYNEITSPLNFNDMRTFELSLKRTPKPKLEKSAFKKRPMSQVIAASSKEINLIFSPILRRMATRVTNSLRDGILINSGFRMDEFEEKLTYAIKPEALSICDVLEIDLSKFDKSQELLALLIDCRLMIKFGMDSELVKFWFFIHVITVLYNRKHVVKQTFAFQRKSGDPLTFLGNTMLTMCSVALYSNVEIAKLALFAGDDSEVFFPKGKAVTYMEGVPDTFNFEVKQFKFKSLYFCSKFLIPFDGRWYFVSDPYKVLEKLGRHDLVNWEHAEEYRISLLDTLKSLFYMELTPTLSEYCHERYGTDIDLTYVIQNIMGILSSRDSFRLLFTDKNRILMSRACDRPKIFDNLKYLSLIIKGNAHAAPIIE